MSRNQRTTSLEWTRVVKKPPKNVTIQQSNITKPQKSPLEIEAENNVRDQKKIDNDVHLNGFLSQPKDDCWIKLIKIAAVDIQKVQYHGIFKGQNEKFYMKIGFSDKMSQNMFVKKIDQEKLETTNEFKNITARIFVHKSFTKFNSYVEKELREMRKKLAIYGFKLNGYLFEAKLSSSSPWVLIDTQKALKRFTAEATEFRENDDRFEKRENLENQEELENQIAIQGFRFMPYRVNDIITKFMEHFKLPQDQVKSHNIAKVKDKWTIFLKLTEKSAHRQILKDKNKKIGFRILAGYNGGYYGNAVITWKRALTDFNEHVNASLAKAIEDKKITRFEFADHRFRVKVDQFSPWIPIECYSNLDLVLVPKKQQVKNVNKTSLYKGNSVENMSTSMSVMSVSSGSKL